MSEKETKFPDYITFPRTFENYAWYKPLIVIVLGAVLYFVFLMILGVVFNVIYGQNIAFAILSGGYETVNNSDASVYISYLSIAIFIPAIYVASRIVRDRPFSSYSSSRGGWNWKLYFKCLSIPFVIYVVFYAIYIFMGNEKGSGTQISLMAMILSLILIPAQGIAEEYLFRGFMMQTVGSWIKYPVLAIIIQTIFFAVIHSYNFIGVINVAISGFIFGFLTWRTNGLEASSAIHSINNLASFYIAALGISSLSSTVSIIDFVISVFLFLISAFAIYYIGDRNGWFDEETPENKLI